MAKRKSWTEKLNAPIEPEVKPVPTDMAGMKAGQVMLIPTPHIIDAYVRAIPAGAETDVPAMRQELAKQHGAEVTCPITTGIHLRTVAEAAYEAFEQGRDLGVITPFWRVLDEKAPTAKKLACGTAFIAQQRERERSTR